MADQAAGIEHPLLTAVAPLLTRVGARLVSADGLGPGDVPLVWEGRTLAGVRLPETSSRASGSKDLDALLEAVQRDLGFRLRDLPRAEKQHAVRLLEERGAFAFRKSAEIVAEALGVSRFTVYNYLNRG